MSTQDPNSPVRYDLTAITTKRSWITSPRRPSIQKIHKQLIEYLDQTSIYILRETPIPDQSDLLIQYHLSVNFPHLDDLEVVDQYISQISYPKLDFPVRIKTVPSDEQISDLKEIVGAVTGSILRTEVTDVEVQITYFPPPSYPKNGNYTGTFIVTFSPLVNNTQIYLNSKTRSSIRTGVNLSMYWDHKLVSTSPFTALAIYLWSGGAEFDNEIYKYLSSIERTEHPIYDRYLQNITLLKTGNLDGVKNKAELRAGIISLVSDLSHSDLHPLETISAIPSLNIRGIKESKLEPFIYLDQPGSYLIPDPDTQDRINLYREIASLWSGDIIHTSDRLGTSPKSNEDLTRPFSSFDFGMATEERRIRCRVNYFVKSSVDFGMPTSRWYFETASRLQMGKLPRYRVVGDWTVSIPDLVSSFDMPAPTDPLGAPLIVDPSDGYNGVDPLIIPTIKVEAKDIYFKFLYYFQKEYLKVLLEEPSLRASLDSLRIYPDFSVDAEFGTYKQVNKFKEYLSATDGGTNDISGLKYGFINNYTLIYPQYYLDGLGGENNFNEAVIIRYYLQRKYPHSLPLIVGLPYDFGISTQVNSDPNKMEYMVVIDRDISEPTKDQLQMAALELEQKLRDYYQICDIFVEQVIPGQETTDLDELDLETLLRIVPVTRNSEAVSESRTQVCIYPPPIMSSRGGIVYSATDFDKSDRFVPSDTFEEPFDIIDSGLYLKQKASAKSSNKTREFGILDEETYLRQKYYRYGLMGYFNPGWMSGYLTYLSPYSQPPYRKEEPKGEVTLHTMIEQYDLGLVVIEPGIIGDSQYLNVRIELPINDTFYSVQYPFGQLTSEPDVIDRREIIYLKLASIQLDRADKEISETLLEDIGLLWDQDWFLSPWAKYILKSTGKLSSVPFRLARQLKLGEESVPDGERVLRAIQMSADLIDSGN